MKRTLTTRLVLLVVSCLLVATTPTWAADEPARVAVETVDTLVLRDSTRGKDIPLYVTFPKREGKLPVIVFSHGAGGSGSMYAPLLQHWASQGHMVIAPKHADLGDNWREVVNKALTDVDGMVGRVDDTRFVIGALAEVEKRTPQLKGRMDTSRIGMAGHSQGAYTAMLLAGATVSLPKRQARESFLDKRPRAFLLLSPPGISPRGDLRGLTEESWRGIDRPMMTVTGTRDFNSTGEGADWRLATFHRAKPGDKFGVNITGASHLSFTGQPAQGKGLGVSRSPEEIATEQRVFDLTQQVTLEYWNAFLKSEVTSLKQLRSTPAKFGKSGDLKIESQ